MALRHCQERAPLGAPAKKGAYSSGLSRPAHGENRLVSRARHQSRSSGGKPGTAGREGSALRSSSSWIFRAVKRMSWRNQRCAGSASIRGCQSMETVISGVGNGRAKHSIPSQRFPTCRFGTVATKSEARARASATEKPPTTVMISRSNPSRFNASSITPLLSPLRETRTCFSAA